LGGLLEPRRGVDRFACDQAARPLTAGQHLTCGNAYPAHRGAELGGRAHGAQRVVLVQLRNAEYGYCRIADQRIECAAVLGRHSSYEQLPALEVCAHRLRVADIGILRAQEPDGHHRHRLA